MSCVPEFPEPIRINGRLFWDEHELENYKRALLGQKLLPRDPNARIKLRPSNDVLTDFGFGRRTLGRRIAKRSDDSTGAAG